MSEFFDLEAQIDDFVDACPLKKSKTNRKNKKKKAKSAEKVLFSSDGESVSGSPTIATVKAEYARKITHINAQAASRKLILESSESETDKAFLVADHDSSSEDSDTLDELEIIEAKLKSRQLLQKKTRLLEQMSQINAQLSRSKTKTKKMPLITAKKRGSKNAKWVTGAATTSEAAEKSEEGPTEILIAVNEKPAAEIAEAKKAADDKVQKLKAKRAAAKCDNDIPEKKSKEDEDQEASDGDESESDAEEGDGSAPQKQQPPQTQTIPDSDPPSESDGDEEEDEEEEFAMDPEEERMLGELPLTADGHLDLDSGELKPFLDPKCPLCDDVVTFGVSDQKLKNGDVKQQSYFRCEGNCMKPWLNSKKDQIKYLIDSALYLDKKTVRHPDKPPRCEKHQTIMRIAWPSAGKDGEFKQVAGFFFLVCDPPTHEDGKRMAKCDTVKCVDLRMKTKKDKQGLERKYAELIGEKAIRNSEHDEGQKKDFQREMLNALAIVNNRRKFGKSDGRKKPKPAGKPKKR